LPTWPRSRTSRRRNRQDDITGLLLFDGASFVQWVEGPQIAVAALRQRLVEDRRHCDMDVALFDVHSRQRRFPDWALGFQYAADEHGELSSLRGLRGPDALAKFERLLAEVDVLAGSAQPRA
jgi:hypothetical protein